jgi:hypothetical protein
MAGKRKSGNQGNNNYEVGRNAEKQVREVIRGKGGNATLSRGSRGAVDVHGNVGGTRVGIQVKYSPRTIPPPLSAAATRRLRKEAKAADAFPAIVYGTDDTGVLCDTRGRIIAVLDLPADYDDSED